MKGAEIEGIHSSNGLHCKVFAIITDNASFAKALRVCQRCYLETESEYEESGDEELTFAFVIEALLTASGDGQISLPPHYTTSIHC